MSSFVLPGDDLSSLIESRLQSNISTNEPVRIQVSSGIIQNGSQVTALKAGQFKNISSSGSLYKFSLSSPQKRYIPVQNDLVIGIVTAKLSELFRIDIGAQLPATVSVLTGFDGATRKNKPNWAVGTLIFARVLLAHPDLEPELACFDASGNIPVDLFGELGGVHAAVSVSAATETETSTPKQVPSSILIRTTCNFSRSLQNPQASPVLSSLGRYFAFEIAAGANGRVFIESGNIRETAAIGQFIERAGKESWSSEELESKVVALSTSFGKKPAKK